MNSKQYVGKRVSSLEEYDSVGPITGIALVIDENNEYLAGDQNGYVLEVECPYGTQAMANNMLASLKGQIYNGYRAENAIMSPKAELGDGVTIAGTYSMLAYRSVEFGPGHMSEIAAPGENELNHEYQYVSPTQRKIERKIAETRSSITKTAEEIRLEVANEINGLSASFTVQLESIESRVIGLNGQMSSITQTVNSIVSRVNGLEGSYSSIEQYVDSITISVSNGSTSSTISLKAGNTTIASQNITFSGFVTFTGLSGGATTINGACIKTGTIDAERLNLTGAITFNDLSSSLYNQVSNSITSSQAQTLINSTLVSSPNIAGGKFYNLAKTAWIEIDSNVGKYGLVLRDNAVYSSLNPVFGVFNGDLGYVTFSGKNYNFLIVDGTTNVSSPRGTWDFSFASVTGIKSLRLSESESVPVAIASSLEERESVNRVTLSDKNGKLKVEADGVAWYLDATGWHQ